MTTQATANAPKNIDRVWRRRFWMLATLWFTSTVLLSSSTVRGFLIWPLYVNDAEASGEVAYVMADGPAVWERLRAASDLYHWGRVKRIVLLEEVKTAGYNFIRQQSDTRVQREIDYLGLYGVPPEKIDTIPQINNAAMGSLSEAKQFAKFMPNVKSVVVVTSAPHTRRSKLCFVRSLPAEVSVSSYAASVPAQSDEIRSPIWWEYGKLVVYWISA